jgi:phospholipid-binding lipoprotein MlaA
MAAEPQDVLMRWVQSRALRLLLLGIACSAVAAPCRAAGDPADPFEGMNRRFFAIEEALDRHAFGPAARGFSRAPSPLRDGLRNFSRNLEEPVIFVNDILQGRPGQAAHTLARLALNTTFGLGGFIDVAKKNHLPHRPNGFGTTLGRWGAGPGPYLFLPLVGPSTLRDAFGGLADAGLNPLSYARYRGKVELSIAVTVIDGLGDRSDAEQDLDTIRRTSTDPYATLRSYYLQNRQAEIHGGAVNVDTLPDLDISPPTGPSASPPKPQPPPQPSVAPSPRPDDAAPEPRP